MTEECGVQTTSRREVVRPARLERATSWFVARRSIQLSYGRASTDFLPGAPEGPAGTFNYTPAPAAPPPASEPQPPEPWRPNSGAVDDRAVAAISASHKNGGDDGDVPRPRPRLPP